MMMIVDYEKSIKSEDSNQVDDGASSQLLTVALLLVLVTVIGP